MSEMRNVTQNAICQDANKASIVGVIHQDLILAYEFNSRRFYKITVRVKRRSGTEDFIPVIVSEEYIKDVMEKLVQGRWVEISGQVRTRNFGENNERHLAVYIFATAVKVYGDGENPDNTHRTFNEVCMEGTICKPVILRQKLKSGRTIADVILTVNGLHRKSYYIPCIVWERSAIWANNLEVGTKIKILGRFQSREYLKKDSNSGEKQLKTIYEISCFAIEQISDKEIVD